MTRWLALAVALIAVVLAQVEPGAEAVGQRFYVKAGATGANDGSSWDDAFKSLQTALFQATAGDEIWVAAGTYKPTTALSGRSASFVLPDSVDVIGSFVGTEASVSQRTIGIVPTSILSGAIGGVSDSDNSYHVVKLPGGISGTLDGFVIESGYASGGGANDRGAGVLVEGESGNYNFVKTLVRNNWADTSGGGISAEGSFSMYDSQISGNRSGVKSGGIEMLDGTAYLERVTFTAQQSPNNSTIGIEGDAQFWGYNVTITGNIAGDDTGVRVYDSGSLRLFNSTLYSNTAVDASPGFLQIGSTGFARLRNTIVWGNSGAEVDVDAGADVEALSTVIEGGCPANVTCTAVFDADPALLAPPSDQGGFVRVLALSPDSPAIDAGTPAQCPSKDARSATRPFDGNDDGNAMCDIGAYEFITQPEISFTSAGGSVAEGIPFNQFDVELSHAYPQEITVVLAVSGTASRPADHNLAGEVVTFKPNDASETIHFTVNDDHLDEPAETIITTLSAPENANPGSILQATYTISDNDNPPTIAFKQAASGKTEGAQPDVRVGLSQPSGYAVSGRLAVSGSATEGDDYELDTISFTIDPGETETMLPLSVVNDYLDEPEETIVLTLDKVAFSTKAPPTTHTYTIKDNDPARFCFGRKVTIIGTPGNDTLIGTPGIDVIEGLNGRDVIRGLGGNDRLCGGPGPDVVRGGAGADQVFGAAGGDRLFGQGGNDLLKGGGGSDTLRGELGRDRLSGGAGKADVCDGGANTDSLLANHRCESVAGVP